MPGEIRGGGFRVLRECVLACIVVGKAVPEEGPHGGFRVSEPLMEIVRLAVMQTDDGYGGPRDGLLRWHVRFQWRKRALGSGLPGRDAAAEQADGEQRCEYA